MKKSDAKNYPNDVAFDNANKRCNDFFNDNQNKKQFCHKGVDIEWKKDGIANPSKTNFNI